MLEEKSVTILMGVYNGAFYLQDMLGSLAQQDHPDWTLLASDDSSTDRSATILQDFLVTRPEGRVLLKSGPAQGFTLNYLTLLAGLDSSKSNWLAFADQDDVWLPQRLSRGLRALEDVVTPSLAAGPVWCVRNDLSQRRMSGGWPRQTEFRNALVQNVVQGNAMLANPAAANLLITAARKVLEAGNIPVSHDWWAYQVVTGAGGQICKIAQPSVLYRQHGGNIIGANDTSLAKMRRLKKAFQGQQRVWAGVNIAALSACKPLLTPEANAALDTFAMMRMTKNPLRKLRALLHLRPVRQTKAGTLVLWAAAMLGRV
jgi:glycosyltransferase involved in cell wall biosynthesis